jgi:hypothetical protein
VKKLVASALLLTASCHKEEPAAPTAEQSAQLNEAEDMLNGMAGGMAQNEEGPEDRSSSPSTNSD